MTFPIYFSPIRIDNNLMYDGGILNNFPINVMSETFNVDYIIGVIVSKPPKEPTEDNLIATLMNLIVEKDPDNYAYNKGIIIKPDIPDLNLIDFKKGKELVEIGYDAIIDSLTTIKQNVNRYVPPTEVAAKRDQFLGKTKEIMIGNVQVQGLNRSQSMFIENIILDKNEIITLEEFKLRYFKSFLKIK